ncbi:MAG: hypothetical protein ACREOZ_02990 [Gloeomargaritales cyanobacterium]
MAQNTCPLSTHLRDAMFLQFHFSLLLDFTHVAMTGQTTADEKPLERARVWLVVVRMDDVSAPCGYILT